ncbi:tetrahydromethanopterin S-methyltransferase subunit F [Methanosarcinales archaeon ex4572_44]|nr:MAG: tetrahydromethanopterin S-methyltransferase subunit F [Methanosarcinales archaeon ex4484_138]PHP46184.1 MAG: tetrahydromethanopterin S-methyltransferase subunit F [Methanosarcinales archaeon ex4572_44]RLG26839.1 MAG: tetrahydromethanopterin S-methyltransferase subunit F [Methanosarcinales archaeon]HHI30588.1 tetrahydromethanopterin S-methyltransferase subunit F [Candidatus Methanoperedenaceae archaeon]
MSDRSGMIPMLGIPRMQECNRMITELERREAIIGKDQRMFSGIFTTRIYFLLGFVIAFVLVMLGLL